MSVWEWVFVTYKSALIKELNHLFWIITLLSKGTAAACLRRNLICLSKNTGWGTAATKEPWEKSDGWQAKAAGDGFDWQPSAIFGICVYFCLVESSVDCLAPCSACSISCKFHLLSVEMDKQQRCCVVISFFFLYLRHADTACFLCCKFD